MRNVVLTVSSGGRRYGAFPSRHDARDFTFPKSIAPIHSQYDWTKFCGPIKNQGTLGSCTGHGAAECQEFLVRLQRDIVDGADGPVFSPLDAYWNIRNREGTVDDDAGGQISTAATVLVKDGICLESEDTYRVDNFRFPPTPAQLASQKKWIGGRYHRLSGLADIRSCIASGYPFLLGFMVYESFEQIGADGIASMPKGNDDPLGGHCVLAGIGYDDDTRLVKCQNSWGPSWGNGGYFFLPYDFVSNPQYAFDAIVVHFGSSW